jgi:hypothetical protein
VGRRGSVRLRNVQSLKPYPLTTSPPCHRSTTAETSRRDPQTRGIAEDGDLLQTEGVSEPSKVVNSNEGMPASREVMSAANTIDDQEESNGAVIEVIGKLEEGQPSVVESDSKPVASPRLHEEGEGFWQEGENGRKGKERHEINTQEHLISAQIVLVTI